MVSCLSAEGGPFTHSPGCLTTMGLEATLAGARATERGFAGADFGFLTSLGNAAIDTVTAEQPGVITFWSSLKTPSTDAEADCSNAGPNRICGTRIYVPKLSRGDCEQHLRTAFRQLGHVGCFVVFRVIRRIPMEA